VVAYVSPGNATSIRLLEKLGFTPAGRTTMSSANDVVEVFALPL
jgi:RimJ/RimL family protein N-acetyltransferase